MGQSPQLRTIVSEEDPLTYFPWTRFLKLACKDALLMPRVFCPHPIKKMIEVPNMQPARGHLCKNNADCMTSSAVRLGNWGHKVWSSWGFTMEWLTRLAKIVQKGTTTRSESYRYQNGIILSRTAWGFHHVLLRLTPRERAAETDPQRRKKLDA